MSLTRYWAYSPMRIGKDTKYSVTTAGDIKLEYQESSRVRWLLAATDHPELVAMVNAVKHELSGRDGGGFYINEFNDVLVPDGEGGSCYYAGTYDKVLEFREDDLFVSPVAPAGLAAGDLWPGPKVGVKYVLAAGGKEIRYQLVSGRRTETVYLSDHTGPSAAARTAQLVAATKGARVALFRERMSGMFAPVGSDGAHRYLYVGNLDEQPWFDRPRRPAL